MLKYRLMSGITLGATIIAALFWEGLPGAIFFLLLATLLLGGGLLEFFKMTEKIGLKGFAKMTVFVGLLTVFSIAIPAIIGFQNKIPFAEFLIITFIIFGFLRVFNEEEHSKGLSKLFVSIAGLVYIGWTLTFICKIYYIDGIDMTGRYLVLYLIAVTKFSDIGAFTAGTISHKILPGGNHKIAPKLSPGKSWEGFFGGMVASIGIALLLLHFFGDKMSVDGAPLLTTWTAVVTGAVFATLGFVGDVAESALKRASGMKDSGNIIPGMGGVLDVVDSLTLVSPLFYCYLTVVLV